MDDIVFEFEESAGSNQRSLQIPNEERGRTILTILYLVVLALCFIIPIFYYFRMHCEDRQARRLHERVRGYVTEQRALQDEGAREEARTARKKYRDEKRARIKQLFEPVRMVLQSHQFHDKGKDNLAKEEEKGLMKTDSGRVISEKLIADVEDGRNHSSKSSWDNVGFDEQTSFVEIPVQGLGSTTDMRLIPDVCAICISDYEPGEALVWSTNSKCEHAFHDECIERWLMKQRGPPLCPCCRDFFVVDSLEKEMNLGDDSLAQDLEDLDLDDLLGAIQDNVSGSIQEDLSGLHQENLSVLNQEDLLVDNLSDSRIEQGGDVEENRSMPCLSGGGER